MIFYEVGHLIKLNKKNDTPNQNGQWFFNQVGHLINLDKNKWHALSQNGQWFFNQMGHLIKLNQKNDIYG